MAKTASPYGLLPVNELSSKVATGAYMEYLCTSLPGTMIGIGELVSFVGGTIVRITAAPAAGTLSANSPIGVFMGAAWTDNVFGYVNADYIPTSINGTISATNPVRVKVFDDPTAIFKIQGNRYVDGTAVGGSQPSVATALGKVGLNTTIGTFTGPNTTTHVSQMVADLSSAPATTNTLPLRIVGFASNPGSAPNDQYPDLLVRFNWATHMFNLATGQ